MMKVERLKRLIGDMFASQMNELIKAEVRKAKAELWKDFNIHLIAVHYSQKNSNSFMIGKIQLLDIKMRHFEEEPGAN